MANASTGAADSGISGWVMLISKKQLPSAPDYERERKSFLIKVF
jgi:hypothetical protein